MKIGIVFGGFSKEREISFAGGRTVYDNLNKALFEPIPIFLDSFGNFILLKWEFIYKGSIRDFYPSTELIPAGNESFQLYSEQIGKLNTQQQLQLINKIGKKLEPEELQTYFDFAFLCLHGPFGEDGKIQQLFENLKIPYSGSGVRASEIGIDKCLQKKFMLKHKFNSPNYVTIEKQKYINGDYDNLFEKAKTEVGLPMVIKPAHQGSSIGISILKDDDNIKFMSAVEKAFFTKWVDATDWINKTSDDKIKFTREITDIREGISLPVKIIFSNFEYSKELIYQPNDLIKFLNETFKTEKDGVVLEAMDGEETVVIEGFIKGKEFSCIVVQTEEGKGIALPPTEIKKGSELFDYRSKYLPGLSRKITPIDLPIDKINLIRKECERLFTELGFNVYARIDGFITESGEVFLNDPNTTSGMMPSSFFFHQAAEIGLNPSQFLTFIIRTSLAQRIEKDKSISKYSELLSKLDDDIKKDRNEGTGKVNVAVILGGYSSERHISVESGRNIYEKLSSSTRYTPIPIFLIGNDQNHEMYKIPINILLKDNADDIKEKIENYNIHPAVKQIIDECIIITTKYSSSNNLEEPKPITYTQLKSIADVVFIALHGRPGEDGAVQKKLEELGIPYNGSGVESSSITIDKFKTNEILKQNGFLVADHLLITQSQWNQNKLDALANIEKKIKFPFIAKPVDDGCSSAVKKIKTKEEFFAFADLIFRETEELDKKAASILQIQDKEEFPRKKVILVEELISKNNAKHFLEITGGMLTKFDANGNIEYEVFEASEALSGGEVLSLEEKFLAGQGQNITPARYSYDKKIRQEISENIKSTFRKAAKLLRIEGYTRIDAFVRISESKNKLATSENSLKIEVIFIEVNSLPGMTPATCIFHQTALNGYSPFQFIDKILEFGIQRNALKV